MVASSFRKLLVVEGVASSFPRLLVVEGAASSFQLEGQEAEGASSYLEILGEVVASSFHQAVGEASQCQGDQVASEAVASSLPLGEGEVDKVDFRNRQVEGVAGDSIHLEGGLEGEVAGRSHLEDPEEVA